VLLGAGREKRIYAVPPYTDVVSLAFDDHPFRVEGFPGIACRLCGATCVYLDELFDGDGGRSWQCNDTAYCQGRREAAP
jgi:alpha-D-ribose 1-methylphosphonate 5-phosphate C-P lyase